MHTIATSIIGVAVTDVRHSVTQSGLSLARFRMVSQPRRFDSTQGQFVDLDASFVTVFAWRAMADNIVASIHKGDPVVVVGRLRVREWVDGESPRVTVEVDAQSIGHDLSRGCARFSKSLRAAGAGPSIHFPLRSFTSIPVVALYWKPTWTLAALPNSTSRPSASTTFFAAS